MPMVTLWLKLPQVREKVAPPGDMGAKVALLGDMGAMVAEAVAVFMVSTHEVPLVGAGQGLHCGARQGPLGEVHLCLPGGSGQDLPVDPGQDRLQDTSPGPLGEADPGLVNLRTVLRMGEGLAITLLLRRDMQINGVHRGPVPDIDLPAAELPATVTQAGNGRTK